MLRTDMEGFWVYIIIFLLSLVAIVINVYGALIERNIVHMENGRKPNAGVSLVCYIVFPIFFVGLACVGNLIIDRLGWYITFGLFFIIFLHAAITLPKMTKRYKKMLAECEEGL